MKNKKLASPSDIGVGKLLVAEPFMHDGFFNKSVILITDYHDLGTIGFVLNRPIRVNIQRLVSDFPEFAGNVYDGGPVQRNTVHYLHTAGEILDGSIEVMPGVYWGGEFNQLKTFIDNGIIGPHDIRFFVGYSGWSPGQLEEEVLQSSWFIEEGDPNYVFFREEQGELWTTILSHKGGNYKIIANTANENQLN